jgi:quinol monooxygenase YgiN
MIHALVQIEVKDFEAFWADFQARGYTLRQAGGSLGAQVFTHAQNPAQVTILFQWDSQALLDKFFQNPQMQALICQPGGINAMCPTLVYKAGELEA